MRAAARILLVDDVKPFNDTLTERLRARGYEVESSYQVSDALARLESAPFDVVILDLKLDGGDGANVGIDVLGQVLDRAPTIKPIIITAYADADSVERAFKSGAYDYVEKTDFGVFEALLLAKIRNALEPAREARMAALINGERESELVKLWQEVKTETDRHKKGAVLEELMLVLWRSIPGFEKTVRNVRGRGEEIDLVVVNQSKDEFWSRDGSLLFLIECKNWTAKVDPKEIAHLFDKMDLRSGRCRLGFFVAPEGFTVGAKGNLITRKRGDKVCVAIGRDELEELVQAKGPAARNELLQNLVLHALS